ncbi:hypothetical protein [Rhizobium sp. AAP43]|uniref:hypothetical protein n=1 Tax=Rhizobium sp. AAP43 TaxID=1523420 RepID=UPI0006B8D386|nr:hypothetical protein [Rhizobium sp. AAP43]KPF41907.1 hypothetical protein IP76_19015 [Rhizobium sp. AAP43]
MTMLSRVRLLCLAAAVGLSAAPLPYFSSPALALSDIRDITPSEPDTSPATSDDTVEPIDPPVVEDTIPVIPDPDPLIRDDEAEAADDLAAEPPAEVFYDLEKAPEPVRRMRRLIMEAALTGDIARLKPLLNPGPEQTQLSALNPDQDILQTLKSMSGDADGLEVLAIMLDILSTGYVVQDKGTPDEAYVWPYFAGKAIGLLTPAEKVELLRIVTAGDVAEMQEYGNYNFFRLGITPDGRWKFFTVGD